MADAEQEPPEAEEPEAQEEAEAPGAADAAPPEPAAPPPPPPAAQPAPPPLSAEELEEQQAAAVRMQAAQRGKGARKTAAQRKAERKRRQQEQEQSAATQLQAVNRGARERRKQKTKKQRDEMAASKIQARFKGGKERKDPMAESNVRRERTKLDPQMQARQYLDKHQLQPLFEQLAQALIFAKPDDPRAFLVSKLQGLRNATDLTSPTLFFDREEVDTLYDMYDAAKRGMTVAQCAEALKALGVDAPPRLPKGAKYVSKLEFRQMVTGGA